MEINADAIAAQALAHYNIPEYKLKFIRGNENLVYCAVCGEKRFALRIHRPSPGMETDRFSGGLAPAQLISSEMSILNHLSAASSFPVQTPVCTREGSLFCTLDDGSPACLLEWLDGDPIGKDPEGKYARMLGTLAAEIHSALSCLEIPLPSYSHDRIAMMSQEIEKAHASGHISNWHRHICLETLSEIDRVMTDLDSDPSEQSIIHADLGLGNVLITPRGLAPIDFSLSGHGYRAHECGMIASNYKDPAHWREVCTGYQETSGVAIDPHHMDAFFSMSVLLFITAQHGRFHGEEWFPAAMDRWCGDCFRRTIG